MRDNNAIRVSRSMRDTAYRAMQTKEQFIHEFGKEPTIEQIAQRMECKKEEVVLALESVVDPVSLYEPVYSDGGDTIYVMDRWGTAATTATGSRKSACGMPSVRWASGKSGS